MMETLTPFVIGFIVGATAMFAIGAICVFIHFYHEEIRKQIEIYGDEEGEEPPAPAPRKKPNKKNDKKSKRKRKKGAAHQ